MSWTITPNWSPADADAAAYITAVETADGQALENGVKVAIDNFVLGCKQDGIWTAIKASCILAGARTLAGCLVPLVGTAPTSFGTAGGWNYVRKTGLAGNGSNNYIDSNRANNADPQNDNHNACWVTSTANGSLMTSSSSNSGQNYLDMNTTSSTRFYNRNSLGLAAISGSVNPGLYGHVRSDSTSYQGRCPQGSVSFSYASQIPESRKIYLLTRSDNDITFSAFSQARLSFYSIGTSLDLAKLDARVTDLMNAFATAIP